MQFVSESRPLYLISKLVDLIEIKRTVFVYLTIDIPPIKELLGKRVHKTKLRRTF